MLIYFFGRSCHLEDATYMSPFRLERIYIYFVLGFKEEEREIDHVF